MTTVREIESFLYGWAPRELAESWDNVGLLVGDPEAAVERVLVALDITPQVAEEALERGCQLIVAHHPVMNCAWHPVQTVRADDRQGRTLTALLRAYRADAAAHEHSFLAAVTAGTTLLETSPLARSAISGDQTLLSLLLGTHVAAIIVTAVNWGMKRHKQCRQADDACLCDGSEQRLVCPARRRACRKHKTGCL